MSGVVVAGGVVVSAGGVVPAAGGVVASGVGEVDGVAGAGVAAGAVASGVTGSCFLQPVTAAAVRIKARANFAGTLSCFMVTSLV